MIEFKEAAKGITLPTDIETTDNESVGRYLQSEMTSYGPINQAIFCFFLGVDGRTEGGF